MNHIETQADRAVETVAEQAGDPGTAVGAALSTAMGAAVSAGSTFTATPWVPGGKPPVFTDMTVCATKGSSSMGQLSPFLATMFAEVGVTVANRAKAGEQWQHMLARDGITPALLTFPGNMIPTSGTVTVTASIPASAAMLAYRGYAEGVLGSLSSNGTTFSWQRITAGDAVMLSGPTEHIPAAVASGGTPVNPSYRHTFMVLDTGKNNVDEVGAVDGIIAALDAEIAWLVPMVKRYLVLGLFANTGSTSTHKANVAAVNADRAEKFGTWFLDIWDYIDSGAAFTDTGITETPTDTAQIAAGEKPSSLSLDNQHLLDEVWEAFTENVIRPRLIELGWYPGLAPWTPLMLPNLAAFLDPAGMADGAITTYTDPATGLVFTGSATVDSDGISGTPAFIFDGVDDTLVATLAAPYTGDVTILAYMQSTVLTTQDYFYDGYNTATSSALRLGGRRNSTAYQIVRGPAVTGAAGDNSPHRWDATYVGTTGTLSIDKGTAASGAINSGVTSPHDRIIVGSRYLADYLGGAVGAFAYVHGTVSSGDLVKWHAWIDARLA
jgi:hypothetical protein